VEYSRAAFAQLFLRAAQDAAAAAASARGHREQEAILLLSVSYSALWAECRFSVLQNAQVPGMGTKRSKNQKTSQKQPSAAAAAAASAAKEKQPSAAAAAAASAAKDPRFSIGDRIGVTSIDRGPVGVYRWAKIVKAYQGGGAFHFHIEWQDDYKLYKAANIEQCLTEKEMMDMEARKTKRPRDKKNAQSSSKKSKTSTNDTGPMHPHQTWPCSQPMMDAYGKKEQLLATQELQEFGLKALKKTQREIATAQKKKDAAAVAAFVERQQVTKEKLARYEIAEAHYENWKADNQTVVAFLESLVMNEATRPTVQQAAVVVRADYQAQKTECDAAKVPGQHAWSVPDRPEGSPLQTLVQLWRGAGMSSGDDQRSLADFLDATHVYALGCILSEALASAGGVRGALIAAETTKVSPPVSPVNDSPWPVQNVDAEATFEEKRDAMATFEAAAQKGMTPAEALKQQRQALNAQIAELLKRQQQLKDEDKEEEEEDSSPDAQVRISWQLFPWAVVPHLGGVAQPCDSLIHRSTESLGH
jgi:hypothetical protein